MYGFDHINHQEHGDSPEFSEDEESEAHEEEEEEEGEDEEEEEEEGFSDEELEEKLREIEALQPELVRSVIHKSRADIVAMVRGEAGRSEFWFRSFASYSQLGSGNRMSSSRGIARNSKGSENVIVM